MANEKILPIIFKHINEPIANIRFNVSLILKEIMSKHSNLSADIKKNVNSLVIDNDKDVKYFTN